jgi:glutathionylspermidine amidase/synthetase
VLFFAIMSKTILGIVMRHTLPHVFFSLISLSSYATENLIIPPTCLKACTSLFATELGNNRGVIGYSNCHSDCESNQWNTIKIDRRLYRTGMKWQCVEYARRWYMKQLGYTFASIDHAYQIWSLVDAGKLGSDVKTTWLKFADGKTRSQPLPNDLLIYNQKQGVHGHVSVIVKVTKKHVYVAEQNYANTPWETTDYARKIPLISNQKGYFTLKDLGVIGWMRLKISPEKSAT